MNPKLSIRLCAIKGEPTYQVTIEDTDRHVNFHSFDCLFYREGDDLEELLSEVKKTRYGKEVLRQLAECIDNVLKE